MLAFAGGTGEGWGHSWAIMHPCLAQAEAWMWECPAAVQCRATHCQRGEPRTRLVQGRSRRICRSRIVYKKTGYRQHREKGPLCTELRAGHPQSSKDQPISEGGVSASHSPYGNGSKETFGQGKLMLLPSVVHIRPGEGGQPIGVDAPPQSVRRLEYMTFVLGKFPADCEDQPTSRRGRSPAWPWTFPSGAA